MKYNYYYNDWLDDGPSMCKLAIGPRKERSPRRGNYVQSFKVCESCQLKPNCEDAITEEYLVYNPDID